ncbi:MAG: bifunctional N(6)-L-threonylcarbamoyladenine synthase/serine/threonine protein kinase [Candidatus Methanoperedens sp.]|nr:bifunctional N(6)-L-threonylcarbamoyladenine synthase/serine/threonine protein kinase [Candidatus Methanoperedens sp.]
MSKISILGLEGTAWNLSAAVVDETDVIAETTATYMPKTGGIHPREAAQHHANHITEVIKETLKKSGRNIDAVAFSQGPGLGPCLRTVATAARALALSLNVPLIGVNHCIAHVEVGRWKTPDSDPVTLYVSGANSQVLAYRKGHYRVFGETLDIGIGNALDKFARWAGLPHPGGPKVEELAKSATRYIPLPYTVKGMDFSFSGLTTAAQESLKNLTLPDVCHSLQETAFSMLVEVTERAVAHTGKREVLLAGGVGANLRLREMLAIMCKDRGVEFYVPEKRFMGDNGAMIAYLGLLMYKTGIRTPIADSKVNPNFRPDDAVVTWKPLGKVLGMSGIPQQSGIIASGAEAVIALEGNTIIKTRIQKRYRLKDIDENIRSDRTKTEAKLISEARRCGVPTPIIRDVTDFEIKMEYIEGTALKNIVNPSLSEQTGELIGRLHTCGIVHGDLTTSNILVPVFKYGVFKLYLIDFGLAYLDKTLEARGVDIHVLFQTFESTHENHEELIEAFKKGYTRAFWGAEEVLERAKEIESRGRYA